MGNVEARYVVRNGTLYEDRNWGTGHDSSVVTSARVTADGGIDVVTRNEAQSTSFEVVFVKLSDGRLRAIMSRDGTGDYILRDGKNVHTGDTPRPQTRCR